MAQGRSPDTGSSPELDEARLLTRIAAGDKLAFETLYRGYFSRLQRFLRRLARSPELIEEVINDTMLVVWQKAASYDGSCKVSTWVFAIAYRKALKGLKLSDEPLESDPGQYLDETGRQPEQELDRRQLQQSVAQALEQLPLAQRVVAVLAYYHEMGYSDIADVLDCPLNTVKTRMFHARQKLKESLANERERCK